MVLGGMESQDLLFILWIRAGEMLTAVSAAPSRFRSVPTRY